MIFLKQTTNIVIGLTIDGLSRLAQATVLKRWSIKSGSTEDFDRIHNSGNLERPFLYKAVVPEEHESCLETSVTLERVSEMGFSWLSQSVKGSQGIVLLGNSRTIQKRNVFRS